MRKEEKERPGSDSFVPDINQMHNVWEGLISSNKQRTELPRLNFDELLSSVFSLGPFYFYTIDFYDMSISNISAGFRAAHGIDPAEVRTINDILMLIHPDDMLFVAKAEQKVFQFAVDHLGREKVTRYKQSYNFRFKTADGSYKLYNHQSATLVVDENGNFIRSLNIHTNISHLTEHNNYKCSVIGLSGEPSYLNMDVWEPEGARTDLSEFSFSKRELEVIRHVASGLATKQIADQLKVSVDTIKTHRKNILRKSGCRNSAELIARGISEGWI